VSEGQDDLGVTRIMDRWPALDDDTLLEKNLQAVRCRPNRPMAKVSAFPTPLGSKPDNAYYSQVVKERFQDIADSISGKRKQQANRSARISRGSVAEIAETFDAAE